MTKYSEEEVKKKVYDAIVRSSNELTISILEVLDKEYGWTSEQLDEFAHKANAYVIKNNQTLRRFNMNRSAMQNPAWLGRGTETVSKDNAVLKPNKWGQGGVIK